MSNNIETFQLGDHVKIIKKVRSRYNKWDNNWAPTMDIFVSKETVYEVIDITYNGIYLRWVSGPETKDALDNSVGRFRWSWDALELVKREDLICYKIKQMYQRRKEAGYAF